MSNASNNGKIKVATVWLGGCAGCHMSFLDIDERIIELAKHIACPSFGRLHVTRQQPQARRVDRQIWRRLQRISGGISLGGSGIVRARLRPGR